MSERPESNTETNIEFQQNFMISVPQEMRITIRTKDWTRVRKSVQSLKTNERHFASVAWAAVGFSSSAALSALTWFPTFGDMNTEQQLGAAWIGPSLVAVAVIVGVLAGLMFWAASIAKTETGASVDQILADLDDLHGSEQT